MYIYIHVYIYILCIARQRVCGYIYICITVLLYYCNTVLLYYCMYVCLYVCMYACLLRVYIYTYVEIDTVNKERPINTNTLCIYVTRVHTYTCVYIILHNYT